VADDQLAQRARENAGDPDGSLALAADLGTSLPIPGRGQTRRRWQLLADVGAVDLTVARVLEAHTDALAILAEAGQPPPTGSWGVFAAEAPGVRLEASPSGTDVTLHGTKPWCSLAGKLDHALVTAHVGDDRGLFAVDLRQPGVHVEQFLDAANAGATLRLSRGQDRSGPLQRVCRQQHAHSQAGRGSTDG